MIRARVYEETGDKMCCFYAGLHDEILYIVDYKEYNIVTHLF
jgi:hypothetical protein